FVLAARSVLASGSTEKKKKSGGKAPHSKITSAQREGYVKSRDYLKIGGSLSLCRNSRVGVKIRIGVYGIGLAWGTGTTRGGTTVLPAGGMGVMSVGSGSGLGPNGTPGVAISGPSSWAT